jgi:hypothetical protein
LTRVYKPLLQRRTQATGHCRLQAKKGVARRVANLLGVREFLGSFLGLAYYIRGSPSDIVKIGHDRLPPHPSQFLTHNCQSLQPNMHNSTPDRQSVVKQAVIAFSFRHEFGHLY